MSKLFIILITFLYTYASSLEINDNRLKYDDFQLLYLEDKSLKFGIEEVSQKEFLDTKKNKFSLGYKKGIVWFKLSIKNNSSKENFILSLNESFYEKANLYYYDKNRWITKSNGVFVPITKREIKNNKLSFDLIIPPGITQTYYIQLQGKYAYFGNISLYEKSYFYFDKQIDINTLYILIFGILIIIVIFNLFLYLTLKEKIYFYYVGYSFFNLIYIINISGLLAYVDLQYYMYDLHMSAAFMIGFLIFFSMEFLEIKKYFKKIYLVFNYFAFIFFFLGLMLMYSYQPWNMLINNLIALINISLIIVSFVVYFKGISNVKYYIFSMLIFFIFVALFTFMVMGVLEYNNMFRYGCFVASTLEVIVFSLMLANRYAEMKNKELKAQNKVLEIQKNQQILLQEEIQIHTKDLHLKNQKLSSLNDERELLLKEVFHRVKNNFHMVVAILWFESEKYAEKGLFKDLINRIKSMSVMHEYLYKSDNLLNINVTTYFNDIVQNILKTYQEVIIQTDISTIDIKFEHISSLGIILNELVNNSIKHNLCQKNLMIKISLDEKDGIVNLVLTDNGKGFDDSDDLECGLGLQLIKDFSRKLPNAIFKFNKKNTSMSFTLSFKQRGINEE